MEQQTLETLAGIATEQSKWANSSGESSIFSDATTGIQESNLEAGNTNCSSSTRQIFHQLYQQLELEMKQFLTAVRLALYVVAIPLTITAVASGHQWLGGQADSQKATTEATHVVRLNDAGMIRGVVKSFDDNGEKLAVSHADATLTKDGELVAKVRTGIDGLFSISNVEPGIYTFNSVGPKSVAAFAVEIVDSNSDKPASSVMSVLASKKSDKVSDLIAEAREIVKPSAKPAADAQVVGSAQAVRLSVSGNFEGFVNSLVGNAEGAKVALVSAGEVISEVKTSDAGRFVFENVQPGSYSFLAIGEMGFAATSVELMPAAPVYSSTNSPLQEEEEFEVTMIQEVPVPAADEEYEIVEETVIVEEMPAPVGPTPAYGGYGYGGGFGGAGGGGFGGFNLSGVGDLIGLGIGAWVLTEVIDQIDDDNNVPTPVPVPNPPAPISGYTYVYL